MILPDSELSLAQRAAAGDRQASDAIGEQYHQAVAAFVRSLGATPDQADEVVQEVFVPTNLRTFRGESALLTYLCGIGRRKLMRLRGAPRSGVARVAAATGSLDQMRDADGFEPLATDRTPEQTVATHEMVARIHSLLDPREAAILELRVDGGLGFPEIADQLGIRLNTAKSLYRRVVQRLRARLRLDDDDPPPPATDDQP